MAKLTVYNASTNGLDLTVTFPDAASEVVLGPGEQKSSELPNTTRGSMFRVTKDGGNTIISGEFMGHLPARIIVGDTKLAPTTITFINLRTDHICTVKIKKISHWTDLQPNEIRVFSNKAEYSIPFGFAKKVAKVQFGGIHDVVFEIQDED